VDVVIELLPWTPWPIGACARAATREVVAFMSWPVLVKMKIAVADALNASAGLRHVEPSLPSWTRRESISTSRRNYPTSKPRRTSRFRSSPVEEGWGNRVAGWQHTRVRLGRLRTSMATPDAELRGESI
jgi:hypothetical protein